MNASKIIRSAFAAALFAGAAGAATAASAGSHHYPYVTDNTPYFHGRVIAGVGPNWHATFIRGVRCHYEYRVQYGPYGPQKVRIHVCN